MVFVSFFWVFLWIGILLCFSGTTVQARETPSALSCSLQEDDEKDPALKEMTYDVGDGPQTTMVYVEPDVTSFYQLEDPPSSTKVTPKFVGFQGKFINLSNQKVSLYWEDFEGGTMHLMRQHKPFAASGTATFPKHRFYYTEPDNPDKILSFMEIKEYPNNIYIYDPYTVPDDPIQTEQNLQVLNSEERDLYDKWQKTILFNEYYFNFTGWLIFLDDDETKKKIEVPQVVEEML